MKYTQEQAQHLSHEEWLCYALAGLIEGVEPETAKRVENILDDDDEV